MLLGQVTVRYCSEHRGHSGDAAHLNMRKEHREHAAGLLAAGIPIDDVLERMQHSAGDSTLSYMHLLTSKNIQNVARDFNISKGAVLNHNDADSVAAWIELNRQADGEKSLVRFIKFQGDADPVNGLSVDDFVLIIISESQISGMIEFCQPLHEVSMDSTHGISEYKYQLTTLMCIDEHGEGFPGAFCYSSRVDECVMSLFLQICKNVIGGPLSAVILMTDDTEVYSNAWNRVMGPPARRLLCSWHVDRAWRKNLNKVKGDTAIKAGVYKMIRTLMEIRDEESFSTHLQQFLSAAKEDDRIGLFADYFEKQYAGRPSL